MEPEWVRESYSQFGEDAILQGYLRSKAYKACGDQLAFKRDGFYIDIGCFHPEMSSNTLWLYQNGWRGINVDATPGVKETFDAARPDDINLQLVMSDRDGEASFFSYGHSVFNTMDRDSVDWSKNPTEVRLPSLTLASLAKQYVPAGKTVDLLSVDVEGYDLTVLQSNDWSTCRPEIVMVELDEPLIERVVDSDIHGFLRRHGYALYAWTPPTLIFTALT